MRNSIGRAGVLIASFLVLLGMFSGAALAQGGYKAIATTSNTHKTKYTDTLLVNGWGLAYQPGQPFWVSDEGTGWSTLYNGTGVPQTLEVVVPSAKGLGAGSPTGIVYNGSAQFLVKGWPSYFLFATLDGTIQGWTPLSNPNESIIAVNNSSSGAIYTGIAVTSHSSNNYIFAADNWNNEIDMYDGNFNLVKSFTDSNLTGMAPFGIQDINGMVYVAFAPVDGSAGGAVDIYDESGNFVKTLISGGQLNQPWGFAMAPSNFGPLSNTLLISNNTNTGTINGFNPSTGAFVGTIKTANGTAIRINQIWGIEFGGGTSNNGQTNQLFFAAGPANNTAGVFGGIEYVQ